MESILRKRLERISKHALIEGAVLCASRRGEEAFERAAVGNIEVDSQYFIASTTKIFTSAMIFMLADEGSLELSTPVGSFIPAEQLRGLQCFGGGDYAELLKI